MATTIDYASDYQTTMSENLSRTIDYDGLTRGKLCPIYVAALTVSGHTSEDKYLAECGPRCAWYDASKERCAVLSVARGR